MNTSMTRYSPITDAIREFLEPCVVYVVSHYHPDWDEREDDSSDDSDHDRDTEFKKHLVGVFRTMERATQAMNEEKLVAMKYFIDIGEAAQSTRFRPFIKTFEAFIGDRSLEDVPYSEKEAFVTEHEVMIRIFFDDYVECVAVPLQ